MVVGLPQAERPLDVSIEEITSAIAIGPCRSRLDLFGVQIDRVDRAMAFDHLQAFLQDGAPHQIVTVNLDFLYLAERNPEFRATINDADLAVADGCRSSGSRMSLACRCQDGSPASSWWLSVVSSRPRPASGCSSLAGRRRWPRSREA